MITRQPGQMPSKTEFAARYEPFLLSLVHINLWSGKGTILAISSMYHFGVAMVLCAMDSGYKGG